MVRYLRIAILPLIAIVMPIPHGMAEDIGMLPPVSANRTAPRLIRVQDSTVRECRRQCDVTFSACVAQARELKQQGARLDAVNEYGALCFKEHDACYRAC